MESLCNLLAQGDLEQIVDSAHRSGCSRSVVTRTTAILPAIRRIWSSSRQALGNSSYSACYSLLAVVIEHFQIRPDKINFSAAQSCPVG